MKLANAVLAGTLAALVLASPLRADESQGAAAPDTAATPEVAPAPEAPATPESTAAPEAATATPGPYLYPAEAAPSPDWVPPDGWRYPALAGDVLVVRPLMVLSLIGGGALFVATLPISAATCTTDDWLHTLRDQVAYTFQRPLGSF
jgi:hypothetical protein